MGCCCFKRQLVFIFFYFVCSVILGIFKCQLAFISDLRISDMHAGHTCSRSQNQVSLDFGLTTSLAFLIFHRKSQTTINYDYKAHIVCRRRPLCYAWRHFRIYQFLNEMLRALAYFLLIFLILTVCFVCGISYSFFRKNDEFISNIARNSNRKAIP